MNRSNDASQRLSIRVGTDDNDMEMTEAITHLSKNAVQNESLQLEEPKADKATVKEDSAPEIEMEETCAISSRAVKEIMDLPDIESSKPRDDTHDDMEMTEAVMNIENTTAQDGPATLICRDLINCDSPKNENNREVTEVSAASHCRFSDFLFTFIYVIFLVKNCTQEFFREIATFSSKTLSFDIFLILTWKMSTIIDFL